VTNSGEWDLRVAIDSTAAGMLSFTLVPSLFDRERDLSQRSRRTRLEDQPAADGPQSFEELLRGRDS
jgi:hypothetical protein